MFGREVQEVGWCQHPCNVPSLIGEEAASGYIAPQRWPRVVWRSQEGAGSPSQPAPPACSSRGHWFTFRTLQGWYISPATPTLPTCVFSAFPDHPGLVSRMSAPHHLWSSSPCPVLARTCLRHFSYVSAPERVATSRC